MALLKYLVPKDGLPDPKGSLSQSIPSRAIAAANNEVTKATSGAMNKCGPYRRYSPEERMEIGRYASDHGSRPNALVHVVAADTQLSFESLHRNFTPVKIFFVNDRPYENLAA